MHYILYAQYGDEEWENFFGESDLFSTVIFTSVTDILNALSGYDLYLNPSFKVVRVNADGSETEI